MRERSPRALVWRALTHALSSRKELMAQRKEYLTRILPPEALDHELNILSERGWELDHMHVVQYVEGPSIMICMVRLINV